MSVYTNPRVWVTGEVVTSAIMNTYVSDNMNAGWPVGSFRYQLANTSAVENLINGAWLECNGVLVSRTTYAALKTLLDGLKVSGLGGSSTLAAPINTAPAAGTSETWAITNGGTGAGWPAGGSANFEAVVDGETICVTGGIGTNSWTVLRGAEGSTPTTHANGAAIVRASEYPFGVGDGVTTFGLPDTRERALYHVGSVAELVRLGKTDVGAYGSRGPNHHHKISSAAAAGSGNQGASKTNGTGTELSSGGSLVDTPGFAAAGIYIVKAL